METKTIKKIGNKFENVLLKKYGCVDLGREYKIKDILVIIREKDKLKIGFELVFCSTSYGRGTSKRFYVNIYRSKFPYTCKEYFEEKELK